DARWKIGNRVGEILTRSCCGNLTVWHNPRRSEANGASESAEPIRHSRITLLLSRESCRILTSNRRQTARVVRHTNGPEPTSSHYLPADLGSVYPDRRPRTRTRVKEARLSIPEVATAQSPRTLIVEERLRLTLSSLRCLRRLATLADEPHGVELFA